MCVCVCVYTHTESRGTERAEGGGRHNGEREQKTATLEPLRGRGLVSTGRSCLVSTGRGLVSRCRGLVSRGRG